MKYIFSVPDMSCNHCKMHIEASLKEWGKAQAWSIDVAGKRVEVESEAPAEEIISTIADAGYAAKPIQ